MKTIAVDFDGTLCENKYPEIGQAKKDVINRLLEEQKRGAKIILWTCRCDKYLKLAVEWCKSKGINFDAVNSNLPELIEKWGTDPRKIAASEYWDDRSVRIT